MTKGKKTRLFDQRDENNLTLAFGSVEAGSGRQDLLATEADRIVLFVTNGGQSHKADETTATANSRVRRKGNQQSISDSHTFPF